MKNIALILALLTCFAACKRTVHDSGCISRNSGPIFVSTVTTADLDTIKTLFNANGLSTQDLQFIAYYSDSAKDTTTFLNQVVSAAHYVNSLPVFGSSYYWIFRNGTLYSPLTANQQYAVPGDDTTGHQTLANLRSTFFATYEKALYSNQNNFRDPHLGRPGIYYHDSCLVARLGYIDAIYQQPNDPTRIYGKNLVKVWQVTVSSFAQVYSRYQGTFPVVYVVDSTGAAWCGNPTYPGEPLIIDPFYANPL